MAGPFGPLFRKDGALKMRFGPIRGSNGPSVGENGWGGGLKPVEDWLEGLPAREQVFGQSGVRDGSSGAQGTDGGPGH